MRGDTRMVLMVGLTFAAVALYLFAPHADMTLVALSTSHLLTSAGLRNPPATYLSRLDAALARRAKSCAAVSAAAQKLANSTSDETETAQHKHTLLAAARHSRPLIRISAWQIQKTKTGHLLPPKDCHVGDVVAPVGGDELFVFGGFSTVYASVTQHVQIFHKPTEKWSLGPKLPAGCAQTHLGTSVHPRGHIIYVVGGQLGAGCLPSVRTAHAFIISSRTFVPLPNVPKARYHPGVAVLTDPSTGSSMLHVYGGGAESRDQSAYDHWRLPLNTGTLRREEEDERPHRPNNGSREELTLKGYQIC